MAENEGGLGPTTKKQIHAAYQAFMFGEGDGKPVSNVKRLCEIGECTPQTISKYIQIWMKKREERLIELNSVGLDVTLSPAVLAANKKDIEFLREQMDAKQWEIKNLRSGIDKLEKMIEFIGNIDDENYADRSEIALKCFDRYLRAHMNIAGLQTQFLALQARWVKLGGIEGLMSVGLTSQTEIAKGKAKLELAAMQGDKGPKLTTGHEVGGVFDTEGDVVQEETPPPDEDDEVDEEG